jgi:ABC-type phosphate transport system ATPase subunit
LLGELSGVFEMRIYSHENSVRGILEDIQSQPTSGRISALAGGSGSSSGINLKLLNKRLNQIDPEEVRRARQRYNLFFEEVMVSADVDRGISFTTVLMILAHYNVISDNKSLK